MQRHVHLKLLIAVLLVQAFSVNEVAAAPVPDQRSPENGAAVPKHGSPEILNEKLIRVRELEGLLKSAVVENDQRLSGSARQSLQQIFAHSYDVFQVEPDTGIAINIRAEAMRILQNASPSVQRDWAQSMAIAADGQLQSAVMSADRISLDAVARQFPMTEAGITAAILSITSEFLQGSDTSIGERLKLLESEYAGTILETFLRQRSRPLKSLLQAAAERPSSHTPVAGRLATRLSISTSAERGTVAPPWPKIKWKWQESVWNYPGAPQPEAGTILESFVPGTVSSLNEFNNWRPVFWGDTIVMRSPFRLVALDRMSGQLMWSLPTSTYTPEFSIEGNPGDNADELNLEFAGRSPESASVGRLASFGLLSFDDEFLFFVDQFDFFRREQPYGFRRRAFNGNRIGMPLFDEENSGPRGIATRLVAIRRSPASGVPSIAWIAGEETNFRYQALTPEAAKAAQNISANVKVSSDGESVQGQRPESIVTAPPHFTHQLLGHRFLCPPVGTGQQLFVLTVQNDQFWLNCLSRTSGQVHWQQPLIFSDDQMSRIWDSWNQANGTSICLLSGDAVICSLAEGILVAVRAADGQLLWATAIRGESRTRPSAGFRLNVPDRDEDIDTTTVLVPLASESVVVCTSNPSSEITGIDSRNGEILWTTPRCAFGPGDVGGSPDYYIVGISDSQVILIGERHCRSIDLKTGEQNWVVGISKTSGRAECRGDRCLIPQSDGQILTLRLKDGSALPRQQLFLPPDATNQPGAVTSDNQVLCVSTPVSLVVFPRVDTMLHEPKAEQEVTDAVAEEVMNQVRAHLINGDSGKAFAVLQHTVSQTSAAKSSEFRQPFEHFLAELILQGWGEQFVKSLEQPDSKSFSALSTSDEATLLSQLQLNSDQQLRSAVMTLLSRPGTELSDEILQELAEFREWTTPITVTDGWSVRPDLLLKRSASNPQPDLARLDTATTVRLRRLAEDGVLFQEVFLRDNDRQLFVNRLIAAGEYAAAETFLGAWIDVTGSSSSAASQPIDALKQLRESDMIAGHLPGESPTDLRPGDVSNATVPAKGLSSTTTDPLVFDFRPTLRVASWEQQHLIDKGLPIRAIPNWNRLKYFMAEGKDGFPQLISMDMSDGSLRDQVVLPFQIHRLGVHIPRVSSMGHSAPGLLPVASADQLTMVSCSIPNKAKVLWTRRYQGATAEDSVIEFGSLGPDHFVWQFGDRLHCSHPLTGRDLWVRQLRLSHGGEFNSGMRRIFGDRIAAVVMGSDASSFERFSTRDGRSLGAGRLTLGQMTDSEMVGRFLLYPDLTGRLHMFDGATGLDGLDDDRPIQLGPHNTRHAFQSLSGGRVLTVSSEFDIILIDTTLGKVIVRTSARDHVNPLDGVQYMFGLTAFERNGRLYVGLQDEQDRRALGIESLRGEGEQKIISGPLLCLNAATGEILWNTRLNDTWIPPLYGDPTDMLVAVRFRASEGDLRRSAETLDIQLISESTGAVIAKSSELSAGKPIRCTHIAAENRIEIVCRNSVISIRAEAP